MENRSIRILLVEDDEDDRGDLFFLCIPVHYLLKLRKKREYTFFVAMKKKHSAIVIPLLTVLLALFLGSCTSVIKREYREEAVRDVSIPALMQSPDTYIGKIFILGGIIVETRVTEEGTSIEAISVPVNRYGSLLDIEPTSNRFIATYPRGYGILDPLIYKKSREITIAGEFHGTQAGRIGDMDYVYPVFEIKDLYLWRERDYYYLYEPLDPWYSPYPYWWYDPWWNRHYSPYYYPYYDRHRHRR